MILVEKVLGNIKDYDSYNQIKVEIEWYERHKRIIKKDNIGIKFDDEKAARGLKSGDVLAIEGDNVYVVEILPTDAIIINVPDISLLAKVCYEIGNKHAPLFQGKSFLELYTPIENPIKVLLEKMGLTVSIGAVYLTDENMISGAIGHSHSHDGGYDGNNGKLEGSFYEHTH